MDISVIVVTYNQEHTIGRTLDSILAQQIDADFEIIIGDDCSTDGTEAVCRRYAALHPDRIVYIRRPKNLGLVANYFDCISRARGRYIADCAGDDLWCDPAKLQRQLELLDSRPDAALTATGWLNRNPEGVLSEPSNMLAAGEYSLRQIAPGFITNAAMVHLCTALYRRFVVTDMMRQHPELMTDPEFSCEDQQIVLACAAAGPVIITPEITLHYSVGHGSLSDQQSFARRYRYSSRAVRQSIILTKHFMPRLSAGERRIFKRFYKKMGNYLAAMAFKGRRQLGSEIKPLPSILRLGTKGRLYRLALRANGIKI